MTKNLLGTSTSISELFLVNMNRKAHQCKWPNGYSIWETGTLYRLTLNCLVTAIGPKVHKSLMEHRCPTECLHYALYLSKTMSGFSVITVANQIVHLIQPFWTCL